jgi:hypothetical protein
MKKYLAPVSLALCPYGFLLLALVPDAWIEELPMAVFFGLLAVQLVIVVCNIRYVRNSELAPVELVKWELLIKLAHLPYYLAVFAICLMLLIAIAVPAFMMAVLFFVPWAVITDVILMLTSSCYGFSAIRRAKSAGSLEPGAALRHTVAHCIFVADVISAFLLWRKLKNQ